MARVFDGSNDHLRNASFTVAASKSKFTLSGFLKRSSSGKAMFGCWDNSTSNLQHGFAVLLWSDGNAYVMYGNGDSSQYAYVANTTYDTFVHVFVHFDGTQTGNSNRLKLWIDGVQQTLTFNVNTNTTTSANLSSIWVGARPNGPEYGASSVTRLAAWYGVDMGETEADAIAGGTAPSAYSSGLIDYWPCPNTTGDEVGTTYTLTDNGGVGGEADPSFGGGGATDLVIAELAHGHPVDGSLALTQAHALALAELLHAHPVDAPVLTQVHVLAVAELAHAQPVDALTLTQTHVLAVHEATHGQPVDALTLTQTHVLSVAELTHGQPIDAAPLSQVHVLSVAEATHAQLLDNLDLSGTASLNVAELSHGHLVDGDLALSQVHVLVVAEATHGQPVDGDLTLAGGATLAVADLTHAQLADAIALGQVHVLAVAEALHGQLLDPLTLTQTHYLVLADGTHAQLVDALTLGTITAVTPGTRLLIVPRELRHLIIAAEQRHITVTH